MTIDLNCDMGESFGSHVVGNDESIIRYVSSVNIACGFHAGDSDVMKKTVDLAVKYNVAIGAHPSYPDMQGFGRREMKLSPSEVYNIIVYQTGALSGFARAAGSSLTHVKPHGALYNVAARTPEIAAAIAMAVHDVDRTLQLVGLSGSYSIIEAEKIGLKCLSEVFADRGYTDNGQLIPRERPGAMISDAEVAASQVLRIVREGVVISDSGKSVPVFAQTVCLHGDGPHALEFAKIIHERLTSANVIIRHP